jgi:preprotein translocase subunit SecF
VVTTSGTETILVQVQSLTAEESAQVVATMAEATGVSAQENISQTDIGPSWGQQVAQRSMIGLAVFLVLVVLFIWAYFREWKMSVAAIVALIHDVVITVGIYSLSGFEVTPATVTGLLTILGFSLYDTVVVFDKVRENTATLRKTHKTYAEAANLAVNQTLVRSINTSIVALLPVGAILYVGVVQLGSGSLKDLALALFVGMATGAYSSIFIATPLLVHMKSGETEIKQSDRRAKARQRHEADRYASVPAYTENMAIGEEPGAEGPLRGESVRDESVPAAAAPVREPAAGRGRVAPPPRSEVRPSPSSGRAQPVRESRSKRGKK